ncbi:hypothetical protein BZG42_00875 [Streptococcus sp. DAT741]|nr:hypothetical protein BZG42_00875 [Streptococcus sp. DAT741]
MDLKVQGRFTPKGSHTCNWLKPKQLRLFFPEFLVRTQLIKIRGRQATPSQNRESKQIVVQSMRFLFLSESCSPSSIKM